MNLPELIKQGRVSTAAIDEMVRPILAAKFRLGLFEHPYVDEARARQVLNAAEHRQAARLAAARSAVLQADHACRRREAHRQFFFRQKRTELLECSGEAVGAGA